MVLSKVSTTVEPTRESYGIEGTLDARLEAVIGSGALTLHAEF